jgi:type II secretion system protein L
MTSVDHIHNLDRRITNEGSAFESVAGSNQTAMQLWVPSERVGLHLIDVPTAPERKWPELIPWLLEDRVLQPVADMHFVIAGRSDGGQLQVLAVSHEDMRNWQRIADNAGVAAQSMVPDYLVLPWEQGRINVGWRDGICLVRTGPQQGFAASADVAWTMIDSLLDSADISPRLSISIPDRALVPERLRELADINDSVIDWEFADIPVTPNLLSGQYRPSARPLPSAAWLPTAGLAALALVMLVSFLQIASNHLQNQVEGLERQLISDYAKLFPSAKRASGDIKAAAEARLNDSFAQQRALNTGSVAGLVALDSLMQSCECDLVSLLADQDSIELTINNGAQLKTRDLIIPGYQIAITQAPNTLADAAADSIVLMINPSAGDRP